MGSADNSPTTRALGDDSAEPAAEGPRSPDPILPPVGHLIAGKYRFEGVLGRGGMGVVVACHQLNLDRPVAIKFLRHPLAANARQRFTREAMAIAKIKSEHVVRVFDAGEEAGQPFIVMERLVGNDLADELRLGPLEPETAVGYLLEACDALADAHSRGLVHRDLKPSNLFITKAANERRAVKVLDFGVSKWLDAAPDGETPLATSDHGFVGTPAYMSPEQLKAPNAVDERADVWALGVVLYQCLTGKRPFEERGAPQLCAAILSSEPAAFDAELGVPDTLAAIVRRCLRKKPEERYQSTRELARALAAFRVPRGRVRRALAAFGVRPWPVAIVLVTVGALAVALVGRSPKPEPVVKTIDRGADGARPPAAPRDVAPEPPRVANAVASATEPAPDAGPAPSASATPPAISSKRSIPLRPLPRSKGVRPSQSSAPSTRRMNPDEYR